MTTTLTSQRFVSLLTRDTLALILAGGRGSRLGALTSHRVKPAVPFGGKYRLIDFPLSNCVNSGIRRIGVMTQYKSHSLIAHLQDSWGFLRREFNEFCEILPAQQRTGPGWYAGTADAIFQNIEIIRAHNPKWVLVLGGDHVYRMDYGTMIGHHVESGADITIGAIEVPVDEARAFGVMQVDAAGRVKAFQEKPEQPAEIPGAPGYALASMGIYVFNTHFLIDALQRDHRLNESTHDFGNDILPFALMQGRALHAFAFRDPSGDKRGYWRDVGNVDAYWNANLELTHVTPPLNLYDNTWPIWTHQAHAPPAKFVFDDDGARGHAIDSMIAGGCVIAGAEVRRSLLFSFIHANKGALIDECVILPEVEIGEGARVRRAVIETGCVIPPGLVIGEDAEADRQRFEISLSGIVLVTPEMLAQELPYVR